MRTLWSHCDLLQRSAFDDVSFFLVSTSAYCLLSCQKCNKVNQAATHKMFSEVIAINAVCTFVDANTTAAKWVNQKTGSNDSGVCDSNLSNVKLCNLSFSMTRTILYLNFKCYFNKVTWWQNWYHYCILAGMSCLESFCIKFACSPCAYGGFSQGTSSVPARTSGLEDGWILIWSYSLTTNTLNPSLSLNACDNPCCTKLLALFSSLPRPPPSCRTFRHAPGHAQSSPEFTWLVRCSNWFISCL